MHSQVRRMGNSHGVIIAKPLLDELGLKSGDPVDMKINKKGRLVISPIRHRVRAGWADASKDIVQSGESGSAWPRTAAGTGPRW
jgi:antitoxin MazE